VVRQKGSFQQRVGTAGLDPDDGSDGANRHRRSSRRPRPTPTPSRSASGLESRSALKCRRMQLLIAVINQEERLDDILAGFLELGITGATVIRSEGMGRMLAQEIPIFAGLQSLLSGGRPQNATVFSVIDDDAKVDGAIALLQQLCGDLNDPATGIAFTLPVSRVVGLAPVLRDPDQP